jgi:hypothetical protein
MLVSKSLVVPAEPSPPFPHSYAERFGRGVVGGLSAVGAAASLAWACLGALRHPRTYLPLTFAQIWEIGIGSLPLVLLVAMIAGAVTSEQTGHQYSSTLPPWIVRSVITASELARTAQSLAGTAGELRVTSRSLAAILAKVDQGHGTLGRALNDASLYEALLTAAAHADEAATGVSALARDVRVRPERYIRVSLF